MAAAMPRIARTLCIAAICFLPYVFASSTANIGSGSSALAVSDRSAKNHRILRLRGGGFFGMGEEKKQEVAVAEPQQAPQAEAPAAQPAQPAQPPPQTLAQHAYEYALAGSMDGIRSGCGQCVGNEVRELFTKAVHHGAWLGGLAFAQSLGRLPFLKRHKDGPEGQGGMQNIQARPTGTGICVCFVTAPTQAVAGALARRLVESGAAACVNEVESVKSTYVASPPLVLRIHMHLPILTKEGYQVWEGKVQQDSEVLLIIKTRQELVQAVQALVKESHPHQVPEVIALNVEQGLPEYLQWVMASTGRPLQDPQATPQSTPQPASSARQAVEAAAAAAAL